MRAENHQEIVDQNLNGETIVLGPDDYLLRCRLDDCHIVLNMHRGSPGIRNSQLRNCTIEAKRKMMNGQFFSSDYVGCRFKGKFSGMDFGRSPWINPVTRKFDQFGELQDCDFTHTTLDLCRFFQVDIARQKFAPWPQFVVPFDRALAASQSLRSWPGKFARYLGLALDENPALSASSGTLAEFQKRFAITEEELRRALDDIGEVIR